MKRTLTGKVLVPRKGGPVVKPASDPDYANRESGAGRPPKDPIKRALWEAARRDREKQKLSAASDKEIERESKKLERASSKVLAGIREESVYAAPSTLTEKEIIDKGMEALTLAEDLATASAMGRLWSSILTGGPGIGKSYSVIEKLQKLHDTRGTRFEVMKVKISPVTFYAKLHDFRQKGDVLVLDDADAVFGEETSLNMLKSALDSNFTRKIGWGVQNSPTLKRMGIEASFLYEGSLIFITNLNLQRLADKGDKIGQHMGAVIDRVYYLDLEMRSRWERFIWTKYMVTRRHIIMTNYGASEKEESMLWKWVMDHRHQMRDISLRTADKVARAWRAFPNTWQRMAARTLLRNDRTYTDTEE